MLTHPRRLFRKTTFQPFRGDAPSNFYTPYNHLSCTKYTLVYLVVLSVGLGALGDLKLGSAPYF